MFERASNIILREVVGLRKRFVILSAITSVLCGVVNFENTVLNLVAFARHYYMYRFDRFYHMKYPNTGHIEILICDSFAIFILLKAFPGLNEQLKDTFCNFFEHIQD